ncbi:hypothetical protein PCI56_25010 [Plesiomonas shigelloides subsp. oncorhynchi]|nr:hypothetical protein [Plesiomonas shigelloides]
MGMPILSVRLDGLQNCEKKENSSLFISNSTFSFAWLTNHKNTKVCSLRIVEKAKLEMNDNLSDNQLAPCWEFQPHLNESNVRRLLAEIASVLEQVYYHRHALDSNWSEGVRAYDWVRNHLIKNEENIPGLQMVTTSLDYVLAMNKVPLQFSKDCIANPKKKHRLHRNKVERQQLSLFGENEAEQDITWRILAEPYLPEDDDDDELQSALPRWQVAIVDSMHMVHKLAWYRINPLHLYHLCHLIPVHFQTKLKLGRHPFVVVQKIKIWM